MLAALPSSSPCCWSASTSPFNAAAAAEGSAVRLAAAGTPEPPPVAPAGALAAGAWAAVVVVVDPRSLVAARFGSLTAWCFAGGGQTRAVAPSGLPAEP